MPLGRRKGGFWDMEPDDYAPAAPAAPAAGPNIPLTVSSPGPVADYGRFRGLPGGAESGRPNFNAPGLPGFEGPEFEFPTFAQAQNEPGFMFRLNAGREALERSASARGILRTGGTLKDFIEYGQNFGAQEYSNVFNRALQAYGAKYQRAKDMFAPRMMEYQLQFGAEQAAAMAEYDREAQRAGMANSNARFQESLIHDILNAPPPQYPGS